MKLTLIFFCFSLCSLLAQPQPVTFAEPQQFPVGANAVSMAVGDFNHDTFQDVAVVSESSNSVSILLGNSSGGFEAPIVVATGTFPKWIATGDFNGDGKIDLAVAGNTPSVTILLGNGNGTFRLGSHVSVGAATFVSVADFNGDGKLDLALVRPNTILILSGKGDGTFQVTSSVTLGYTPSAVATGDFRGIGKLDLIVAGYKTQTTAIVPILTRYPGNGDGTFQAAVVLPVGGEPTALVIADLNGDGKADLAAAVQSIGPSHPASQAEILIGNGDGTFGKPAYYGAGESANSIAVADFNFDNKIDIAMANTGSATVSTFLGNGDGTFQTSYNFAAQLTPVVLALGNFTPLSPQSTDILVLNKYAYLNAARGAVSILRGYGDGTFLVPHYARIPAGPTGFPFLADFNHDANLDALFPTAQGVSIMLGRGYGTFQDPVQVFAAASANVVGTGDFNRDGKPDALITFLSGSSVNALVLLGNGDGTFHAAGTPTSGVFLNSLIGDVNGDGILDVISVGEPSGSATVEVVALLGKGDGTFKLPVITPAPSLNNGAQVGAMGDFNGDGRLDLVTVNGGPALMLGNGDGTFQTPSPLAQAAGYQAVTGDFDGDGKLDLALAFSSVAGPAATILLGNGDGTFRTGQSPTFNAKGASMFLQTVDLNLDSKADLVFGLRSVQLTAGVGASTLQFVSNYAIFLNNGNASFTLQPLNFTVPGSVPFFAIGDLVGNGGLDILDMSSAPGLDSALINSKR